MRLYRPLVGSIALLLAMTTHTANAQSIREHDGGKGLRSFHGGLPKIRRSFESDAEAKRVFDQIVSAVGLNFIGDRIVLRASADTTNAEAFISKDGSERLIMYSPDFMQRLKLRTAEYWSLISVLAHEIGHHLAFHTVVAGRDHEFELEADRFSGFVMGKLGATLDQAQAGMREIASPVASATHPAADDRIAAITLGWTDATTSGRLPSRSPQPEQKVVVTTKPSLGSGSVGYPSKVLPDAPPLQRSEPKAPPTRKPEPRTCVNIGSPFGLTLTVKKGTLLCSQSEPRETAEVVEVTETAVIYKVNGANHQPCRFSDAACGFAWGGGQMRILFAARPRPDTAHLETPSAMLVPIR